MKLPDKVDSEPRDDNRARTLPKPKSGIALIYYKITSIFDYSLEGKLADANSRTDQYAPLEVETTWKAYLRQERFWSSRLWRVSLYTLLMFLFLLYILVPILGQPITPTRGLHALGIYKWVSRTDFILMLFLAFFVFDATCFCLLLVNKLRRAKTRWPNATMKDFQNRLRLQTELIHGWINLEFVDKRTRCIGWLIYYPFVLIALLILSRSTVFANYAPSPTILVAQGISLSVVFGCAIMLWWAATAARDAAKHNLTDEIIWAKGPSALVCIIDAAPTNAVSQANAGGAAGDAVLPLIHTDKPKEASADPPQQQKDPENCRYAEKLETLLCRVEQLRDGAFGPFTQQPLIRAVILPMGSFGWTALLENGMLPRL